MPPGPPPVAMVAGEAVKAPVEVLREYWETVLAPLFATYTEAPSGEMVMRHGRIPAAMVARAVSSPPLPLPSSTADRVVPASATVLPTVISVEVAEY